MATVKFGTIKGGGSLTTDQYYIGIVQHERIMSKAEAYDLVAEKTGFKAPVIAAVVMALKEFARENAAKGNITYIDGVASIRNSVKGYFESSGGPWVKGRNYLMVKAVPLDPFKSLLAGIIPVNMTGGASPVINTVLDETTGLYDIIAGTDTFSVAGSDLGPDTTKTDEYVALVGSDGVEHKCTVSYSDLGNVKAALPAAIAAGKYTLAVYTRSGMGEEYGVKRATRIVTIA